jgi:lipopolysaccharide/colanic/teichoic acid biosynthesis glycosyltransferase
VHWAKRSLDLILSFTGLLALSPILLITAILIKLNSPGPVFYRGIRVGQFGKPFRIFKFRTMAEDAEGLGASSTAEDDPRITSLGRFLRRHKLDESPQLINVLLGEMSLVGPRPQVPWAVALYSEEEKQLLEIRPGITDYASLRFPNEGKILRGSSDPDRDYLEKIHPEKMLLSLEYLKHQSFWLDCKILAKTLITVVFAPRVQNPIAGAETRRTHQRI